MTGLAKVIRNLDKDGILVIDTPLKANKALSLERGKSSLLIIGILTAAQNYVLR